MTERICNQHDGHNHNHSNMKRTAIVVSLTLITMIAEIGYGLITGSMALLADGIHMGTHTFALIVTLIAYIITDAMTSVLAIIALLIGKFFGQTWPDALVAILGAIVILKWAYDLLISSGKLLVDYHPASNDNEQIQSIAKESESEVKDLHIWRTSENHKVMILKLKAGSKFNKEDFIEKIKIVCSCNHLTLEVE